MFINYIDHKSNQMRSYYILSTKSKLGLALSLYIAYLLLPIIINIVCCEEREKTVLYMHVAKVYICLIILR